MAYKYKVKKWHYMFISVIYIVLTLISLRFILTNRSPNLSMFLLTICFSILSLMIALGSKEFRIGRISQKIGYYYVFQIMLSIFILVGLINSNIAILIIILGFLVVLFATPTILWFYGMTYLLTLEQSILLFIGLKIIELIVVLKSSKK